jgi:nucleotide-binding universal stress UspA family protein
MKVNRAQISLLSQSERAMKHAPQNAKISVRVGTPLQTISDVAREWEPDLIVMASPHRRRLDALVGTTAERVIRATHRSVLVVGGFASEKYERVVLATDLSATSAHVARTAAGMGVLEHARTWVVHAFDPPYAGLTATDAQMRQLMVEHKRQWRHAVTRELVGELGIEPARVQVCAHAARPVEAIETVIRRVDPDLLVIGVSRWFMLKRIIGGSVADQVFRRFDCDILAVSPRPIRKTWLKAA